MKCLKLIILLILISIACLIISFLMLKNIFVFFAKISFVCAILLFLYGVFYIFFVRKK